MKLFNLVLVPNDLNMRYSNLIVAKTMEELYKKTIEIVHCTNEEINQLLHECDTYGFSIGSYLRGDVYSAKLFETEISDNVSTVVTVYFQSESNTICHMMLFQDSDIEAMTNRLAEFFDNEGYLDAYLSKDDTKELMDRLQEEKELLYEDLGVLEASFCLSEQNIATVLH